MPGLFEQLTNGPKAHPLIDGCPPKPKRITNSQVRDLNRAIAHDQEVERAKKRAESETWSSDK